MKTNMNAEEILTKPDGEMPQQASGTELESELRIFRRSFLDSSDAIMITDTDGKIVDVNPAFCRVYGYSRKEAVGQTPRILRSETSRPELYQEMWKDILNPHKGFWKGEITNRRKDGTQIPVLLSITPIRDSRGRTIHYMGLAIDISEKRRLERKVNQLRREYGAFMRHEMRNMLTVIIGYIELALNYGGAMTSRLQKLLKSALNSAQSTLKIIEMLGELEHYETGHIKLNLKIVSLRELLQNVCSHLKPLADEKGVRIALEARIEDDRARVDPPKMESVFFNLLKNAIEHVAGIPDEVVTVSIFQERERLAVAVNNRGEPISAERLATFFERFNTTKKETGGTGLGTTYAALITRAHQGDIRVASNAEEGTTVTVLLPQYGT